MAFPDMSHPDTHDASPVEWLALVDPCGPQLLPAGRSLARQDPPDLHQCTFLTELNQYHFGAGAVVLDGLSGLDQLHLSAPTEGQIALRMRLGGVTVTANLTVRRSQLQRAVLLGLSWDMTRGSARLWLGTPKGAAPQMVRFDLPRPPSWAVIKSAFDRAVLPAGCAYVALAAGQLPLGPLPGLDPDALIATPQGDRPLHSLRIGDPVEMMDGQTGHVCWCQRLSLPARNLFHPFQLRAPYLGLVRDLTLAQHQDLNVRGPDVEYLFNQRAVRVPTASLREHASLAWVEVPPCFTYIGLALDRPGPMRINGTGVEQPDFSGVLADPDLVAASAIAALPAAGHAALQRQNPQIAPLSAQDVSCLLQFRGW